MATYYHGLKRGANNNPGNVTIGTSSAGSAVDVEVRLLTDNGLTVKDVELLLDTIRDEIVQRGITGNLGLDLPVL